jgi:hypothetical protein
MSWLALMTLGAALAFCACAERNWRLGARMPAMLDGAACLAMAALTATILVIP